MTCINHQKTIFAILMVWILLSSFYYAPNLISGELITGREDNIFHKAFKYIAAILLISLYAITQRNAMLYFQLSLLLIIAAIFAALVSAGIDVNFGLEAIVVLTAFVGFSYIAAEFDQNQIIVLVKIFVFSAFIISIISYFEYYLFEEILGDFWRNTGGFRSVSTLLNPNNLGVYLGAALVILIFSTAHGIKTKFIFGIVILGALYLSGSRTAWVVLGFIVFIGLVYKGGTTVQLKSILQTFALASVISVGILLLIYNQTELINERLSNFETAGIRIEKYFEFILNADGSYLLPDASESRVVLVSESGYFHFVNSVGALVALSIGAILMLNIRVGWVLSLFSRSRNRSFALLTLYYAIASFFENVLMSFPNNQMFFIAVGVTIASMRNDRGIMKFKTNPRMT